MGKRVIDLYCGAGGFSEGFRQAGYEIILGVDNWDVACRTYEINQRCEVWCEDILKINSLPECEVLIGSPPCQEWSIGKNKKRKFDMRFIDKFMGLVRLTGARSWIWECVPTTKKLTDNCVVLNAENYSVPQRRKRAFHSNQAISPPPHPTIITVDKALGWGYPKVLFNHMALNIKAYSPIYLSNRPARTAVTWPIRIYKEGVMSVEQMKIIQSFPESYEFTGSKADKYRQIGNAVPPMLSKAIATSLGGVC